MFTALPVTVSPSASLSTRILESSEISLSLLGLEDEHVTSGSFVRSKTHFFTSPRALISWFNAVVSVFMDLGDPIKSLKANSYMVYTSHKLKEFVILHGIYSVLSS